MNIGSSKNKILTIIALLAVIVFPCSGSKVDFSRETPPLGLINNAAQYGQDANYEVNPATGKTALHMKWDGNKFAWTQAHLAGAAKISFPDSGVIKFLIKVTTVSACPVNNFNLRLMDASGEVFQFRKKVFWDKAGNWVLEYDVNAAAPETQSIWGGDKNRKFDFPVKLLGVAAEFVKGSGFGELYINSIESVSPQPENHAMINAELATPLLDPSAKPQLLSAGADYLYVTDQATKATVIKIFWKKLSKDGFDLSYCKIGPMGANASAPKLPDFTNAVLRVTVATAGAIPNRNFDIVLIDASGKILRFSQPIKWDNAGTRTIDFNIDAAAPRCKSITGNYIRSKNNRIDFPVRFAGISAGAPKDSSGELFLHKITLKTEQRLIDAIRLEIQTGHPLHILEPGKESELKVNLTNILQAPITVDGSIAISDFDGKKLPWSRNEKLSFAPGEVKTFILPPPPAFGIWYVDYRVATPADINDSKILRQSFVYMKPVGATPAKKTDGFIFGINSHPERTPTQIDLEAQAISLIGAKVVRFVIGMPNDYRIYDEIVEKFAKQGVNFDLILDYPTFAKSGKPDFAAWRQGTRKIFEHYKGKVRYWEVLNEPDLGSSPDPTPEDYISLAKIAREELSEADPNALLISAGFCNFGTPKRGQFQEAVMSQAHGIFDIHCFHGHSDFITFSKRTIDGLLLPMRQRANVTMPWYANETALTSTNRTEKVQAQALFKKLLFSWSRGAIGFNWYNLRNKGEDQKNDETQLRHAEPGFLSQSSLCRL